MLEVSFVALGGWLSLAFLLGWLAGDAFAWKWGRKAGYLERQIEELESRAAGWTAAPSEEAD